MKALLLLACAVASQNGRSVNKEIEFRMREVIRAYETEHGPIRLEKDAR